MKVRFLLISEGSSERPLVEHLQVLCVRAGAEEASGNAPDLSRLPSPPGRRLDEKIAALLSNEPAPDILFVHRDADRSGRAARVAEIESAALELGPRSIPVPIIPVRALEAWLLVDEAAIRRVVANPRGKDALSLPALAQVEAEADPKRVLQEALAVASGRSGRRLKQVRKDFPAHRAQLLEQLEVDGPVTELSAWRDLVRDIEAAVARLASEVGTAEPG